MFTEYNVIRPLRPESRGLTGRSGVTLASKSALGSAGTFLSRVQAPQLALWPDGEPESLRSPCCGLDIYKNQLL
ncbi:hypothetical protein PoB_002864100 [Plakobranchus ocellatus]|uniref:Uncharacterized protein n=1 Tax=Plakobranchus ocellatus TaxID=259542 RepID=A0AAV4A1V1_9GAST|nr:hypothetical protein PoB_002864100 [Plakobranchus ocellatus]